MITWPRTIDGKPVAHYENLRVALEHLEVTVYRTGHPHRFEIVQHGQLISRRWLQLQLHRVGLQMATVRFLILVALPARVAE